MSAIGRFRARYGAGPWHVVGFLASLAVSALAIKRVFDSDPTNTREVLEWFAGAVVLHDLIFLPLYSLLGQGLRPLGSWSAYIRVPALLSGLLFLVFFPLILHRGLGDYFDATSLNEDPYLGRWLTATGVLFGLSLLVACGRGARQWGRGAGTRLARRPVPAVAGPSSASAATLAEPDERPPADGDTTHEVRPLPETEPEPPGDDEALADGPTPQPTPKPPGDDE